jgi:hypothetical protein
MARTEAQKAALAAGRAKASQNRKTRSTQPKATEPVASAPVEVQQVTAAYICKRRLKVGDGYREPGELVPEAATWPNLRRYIDQGWVEFAPVVNGVLQTLLPAAPNPNASLAEGLQPEGTRSTVPVGAQYKAAGEDLIETQCFNCRQVNHLPPELLENKANVWECFRCHQPQTIEQSGSFPVQSREEQDRQIMVNQLDNRQPAGIRPRSVRQRQVTDSHIDASPGILDPANPIPGR